MSFYLGELVAAAEGQDASVEQQQDIVEFILRLWSYRYTFPVAGPLSEYSNVLAALQRLADDHPWRFARLSLSDDMSQDPEALPMIMLALELENACREAVISLLAVASRRASATGDAWLQAVDGLVESMEGEMTRRLEQLLRSAELRQMSFGVGFDADDDDDDDDDDDEPAQPTQGLGFMSARLRHVAQELIDAADLLDSENLGDVGGLRLDGHSS